MVKQLSSSEAAHREAAVYALASIGTAANEAISELKKLKKDNDVLIRDAAAKAIKSIETPSPTVDEAKDGQNK